MARFDNSPAKTTSAWARVPKVEVLPRPEPATGALGELRPCWNKFSRLLRRGVRSQSRDARTEGASTRPQQKSEMGCGDEKETRRTARVPAKPSKNGLYATEI